MNGQQHLFLDRQEIAKCAYLIWEKEGRPWGKELQHWIQAESQLWADYQEEHNLLPKKSEDALRERKRALKKPR